MIGVWCIHRLKSLEKTITSCESICEFEASVVQIDEIVI